jgi:hypothetical protein
MTKIIVLELCLQAKLTLLIRLKLRSNRRSSLQYEVVPPDSRTAKSYKRNRLEDISVLLVIYTENTNTHQLGNW